VGPLRSAWNAGRSSDADGRWAIHGGADDAPAIRGAPIPSAETLPELPYFLGARPDSRSLTIRCAAIFPGAPITQPPGCVPEPHW
jgi:hypothetical protein